MRHLPRAIAVLVLVVNFTLPPLLGSADAFTVAKRYHRCRFESLDGHGGFTSWETRSTIACAVNHFPVIGGFATALAIAERESGLYCHARNPYSSATGIFQVVQGTWDAWWATFGPISERWGWNLGYDRSQCRSNIVISIRAMHRYGTGPWGGKWRPPTRGERQVSDPKDGMPIGKQAPMWVCLTLLGAWAVGFASFIVAWGRA